MCCFRVESLSYSPLTFPKVSPCAVLCLIAQSCLTLCHLMDYSPPGFSVHGDSPGKNTGVVCQALLQGIFPIQGLNRSSTLYVDSSLSELPGKPKNAGVGSLSLLQGIFLTQESNWGLLHWRQVFFLFVCLFFFYQLSYQGSPE